MPKRLAPFACLAILLVLGLAACGGGGDTSGGSGAVAEIEEAVKDSAIQADPASCTELNTQHFDEQLAHEKGKKAVKLCEEEAESESAKASDVTVANVKVDGSGATLEATMDGTIFSGQTVAVSVVEEGGKWKVDQITRIVKFDPKKLEETFKEQLEEVGEVPAPQVRCLAEALGGVSRKQAEEVLLTSSAQPLIEVASSAGC